MKYRWVCVGVYAKSCIARNERGFEQRPTAYRQNQIVHPLPCRTRILILLFHFSGATPLTLRTSDGRRRYYNQWPRSQSPTSSLSPPSIYFHDGRRLHSLAPVFCDSVSDFIGVVASPLRVPPSSIRCS
jgi:hypothetical protein